jgi:hypothetical protein
MKGRSHMRKRETHINVRTTPQEKIRFQRCARKCGLSLSEYLRKLANGYEPRAAPSDEYGELTCLLNSIYNDYRESGNADYARLLARVLLELQESIAPAKRNGDHEDLAGA